jgi:hypothetical protein
VRRERFEAIGVALAQGSLEPADFAFIPGILDAEWMDKLLQACTPVYHGTLVRRRNSSPFRSLILIFANLFREPSLALSGELPNHK